MSRMARDSCRGRSGSQVDRWSLGEFNDRQLNANLGAAVRRPLFLDVMED